MVRAGGEALAYRCVGSMCFGGRRRHVQTLVHLLPFTKLKIVKKNAHAPPLSLAFTTPLHPPPQEELFMRFAEFEERCREVDRARAIYRYALDHLPKSQVGGAGALFSPFFLLLLGVGCGCRGPSRMLCSFTPT